MPLGMPSALDRFLNIFRVKPPTLPPEVQKLAELSPADYQNRREQMPLIPMSGWGPEQIQQMLESHDSGNFALSELFYHALRKEGLIASALDLRRQAVQIFTHTLQCPKDAPPEFHAFTEALAKDWQSVMPDDTRGIIIERTNVFGFCVCRVQWTYKNGQRQFRLIPWTQSSLSWRQDLWCYQGQSEDGIEYIRSDGREYVVFDLGEDRPFLRGLIRPLAFVLFGILTGDDRWLNFNDKFAEPMKVRVIPRLMRESIEAQRVYQKEQYMRGGDTVLCPQDENGRGYDFRYAQVDAQGYKTLADMLERYDERAAIIILGHNLLQRVKGGSLAAMTGALSLLATKAQADGKALQSGLEPVSQVWARANFGTNPDDFEELHGELPEAKSWALVYDFTTPEEKQAAGVRAAQFGQAFASFIKALVGKDGISGLDSKKAIEVLNAIDFIEAARRCGLPLKSGEEAYAQQGEEKALDAIAGRRQGRMPALLSAGDLGPGVMIALFPRPDEAQAAAMPGGEAVEELHVTLGYLGRAAELPPKWLETLHQQAAAISQQSGPLVGILGGLGRFSGSESSEGRDVIYATPNVVGLTELRQKLAAACSAAGVPFRANHGFTPHMTLAYIDPGAPMPAQRLEPRPVHFDAILVCVGQSRWEFPLIGSTVEVLSGEPDVAPALREPPISPPSAAQPLLLASGDSPDSAAGLIEGQQQIDAMADQDEGGGAPALAAILAALAAAADWSDLRGRLADIVRDFDLRDAQSALREKLRTADTIGALSVDHDLAPAARAEVDAADRRRGQADKIGELRLQQERASLLARAATAYALFAVARHLWDGADRAAALGQPLEAHKTELAEALRSGWGSGGALWDTARAEPLQHAFTHARAQRLSSEPLRAVYPYWRYEAVLDGRTTPTCRGLNGLVRPAGSPDFPVPPLHWHCRSTVRGLSRAEGEALVTAPVSAHAESGFGSIGGYPAPESGPEPLLAAYRSRV